MHEELTEMGRVTLHRGPDEGSVHIEPGVGLAHRRLSIIDIATGQQPLFNEDGSVRYMVGVGCSINNLMKTKEQLKLFRKDLDFFEENIEKYLSMTDREKQILKLITDEFTSVEIAEKLAISPYTVDTHRKNLIQKLEVKSSIGLAKYALLFNLV